ncbi:MAG: hypothetical protein KAY37_11985 [Phycisphaerae bacterium]|nr:hypothetical protein [Phycisphaerae bacterium]
MNAFFAEPKPTTIPEIRKAGLEALCERLGPAGTLRFLQQFDPGHGDYTKNRHSWLDHLTVDEIAESIKKRRRA